MQFEDIVSTIKAAALGAVFTAETAWTANGAGKAKLRAGAHAIKSVGLTMLDSAEALIPVFGAALNSSQAQQIESSLWDSAEAKLADMAEMVVENAFQSLKHLFGG